LSQHHLDALRSSAISDDIITARGYATVERAADLERIGFGRTQRRVPALLLPVHGVWGGVVNYQIRPDAPRIVGGKTVKYETPHGTNMVLDVHPHARALHNEPSVPLFITEGIKKGDALVSKGGCTATLLGVWNWRGTNDLGGKTVLADWDQIALNGRRVYVVFDSDVMLKTSVHAALVRLRSFLEAQGADVAVIYLPSGPHGEKAGIDDYFAAGHALDEVMALATADRRSPPQEDRTDDATYTATPAGLVWHKPTKEGSIPMSLTNFTASIISDVVEDDGAERRRVFEIEATLHGRPSTFQVPATQFATMNWATEYLGAGAIVYPGFGTKDHARAAIQILSGDVPEREVFAHTGWRRIGGQWIYLHAGGGIGRDGAMSACEVRLGEPLATIRLPDPPNGSDLAAAVRTSLSMLALAPLDVTAPVLGATYLAPLIEPLGGARPDLVPWLHGPSGAFKSELAALGQCHFGAFTRTTLPANFMATANAIERLCFAAKDALLVVDDYHPSHDRREEQVMAAIAQRLLRGVGNGAGRQRMRPDTSMRQPLPPRALVIATGERLPSGQSTAARMFPVPIIPGAIDTARLTELQAHTDQLPLAMAGYIQWIAQRLETLQEPLPHRYHDLRAKAQTGAGHAREPGQVAHLQLGLQLLLEFAVEIGSITPGAADTLLADTWAALFRLATEHAGDQQGATPVTRFVTLLAEGIASKRGYLVAKDGGTPGDPTAWGWEHVPRLDPSGNTHRDLRHPAGAVLLGAVDESWLYLTPSVAHAFAASAARASDEQFPADLDTLLRRLAEAGVIATQEGGKRRTVKVRLGSVEPRVIKLRRSALDALSSADHGEHGEHGERADATDSDVPPTCSPPEPAEGNDQGNNQILKRAMFPPFPLFPLLRIGRTGRSTRCEPRRPLGRPQATWPAAPCLRRRVDRRRPTRWGHDRHARSHRGQ
jgi:hypothetical protein